MRIIAFRMRIIATSGLTRLHRFIRLCNRLGEQLQASRSSDSNSCSLFEPVSSMYVQRHIGELTLCRLQYARLITNQRCSELHLSIMTTCVAKQGGAAWQHFWCCLWCHRDCCKRLKRRSLSHIPTSAWTGMAHAQPVCNRAHSISGSRCTTVQPSLQQYLMARSELARTLR